MTIKLPYEHISIADADVYLCRMLESDADEALIENLQRAHPALFENMSASARKRERATEAALLNTLYPGADWSLRHMQNGAPQLTLQDQPLSVSISHSRTHLAICIAPVEARVGVDIENSTPRLQRLVSGFLSDAEAKMWCGSAERLLMAWTAKEAAFKAFYGAPHALKAVSLSAPHADPVAATYQDLTCEIDFHQGIGFCVAVATVR